GPLDTAAVALCFSHGCGRLLDALSALSGCLTTGYNGDMKMKAMPLIKSVLAVVALSILFVAPCVVQACPSCQDAPAANGTDEDGAANAKAYNNSIYLMVGVPYFSFGIVGFMIYRGMKKNEA